MRNTRSFVLSIFLPASLFARSKVLSSQSKAGNSEEKTTRGATYAGLVSIRLLITLVLASILSTSILAQSTSTEASQISAGQSPEAAAAVLQDAEKAGSMVIATIELQVPLAADSLEFVDVPGQIQSILVSSTTSAWKGAMYSAPDAPITSLAQGLRSYEQLYHDAGPGDYDAFFVVTAFTIRGSASEISRARNSLPGAKLLSVGEVSKSSVRAQSLKAPSVKPESETVETMQAATASAAPSTSTPFVPSNSELNIQTLANSDRRIDVTFSWNSPADLAGLDYDRSTLEIQVLFWNHAADVKNNNVTYVGPMKAWGTNDTFFHSYFDTPALNGVGIGGSPSEREVTIGSFDARSDFQAGKQYKVWAITAKGALDANFAKLSFQRGIFMPSLLENLAVNRYCELQYRSTGKYDPANCVAGKETVIVTPKNYIGTSFSILAPTVPAFTYPTQACSIPPGYPFIGNGMSLSTITEPKAREHVSRILPFQKAFSVNGGRSALGCPTNFAHQDTAWWPRGGWTQDFDGIQTGKGSGAVLLAPGASQAFWIHGAIWARYSSSQFGGPKSAVGEPTGDEQPVTSSKGTKGAYQSFTRGWLYFNGAKNQTFYVVNAIAQKYQSVAMHTDQLGFPISDEYAWNGGSRSDFEGGYIYWTASTGAVIVRNQTLSRPAIGNYSWSTTPIAGRAFGGTITGTGFVVGGTQVWFCVNNSNTCYQQPAAGVTVSSSTSLSVSNVNLGAGSWQVYVQTSAGPSARSTPFTVQVLQLPQPLPTIGGYSWNMTPIAGRAFGGTITGTGFMYGNTQVWFCVNNSNTCYQHPSAGVTVNSSTNLSVNNVNLGAGSWQVYVQTLAGRSARSSAFTIQAGAPTISGFFWSPTPTGTQPFSGTITGANFISGGTQVFFCVSGTGTCYQQPSAGVNVNSTTSLSVSNVRLSTGSWQIYVQTSAGPSGRSSTFAVR